MSTEATKPREHIGLTARQRAKLLTAELAERRQRIASTGARIQKLAERIWELRGTR